MTRAASIAGAIAIVAVASCKKAGTEAPGPAATAVPARWAKLRLPSDALKEVQARTDDHGYYADYAGDDAAVLWDKVGAALKAAGYAPACTIFDGNVRGFTKGDDKLAVKIDSLPVLALSIFDEQAKEWLLHGACFGKYQVGPPRRIK